MKAGAKNGRITVIKKERFLDRNLYSTSVMLFQPLQAISVVHSPIY
jgi:hypothetical protein